jgi:hypothetical protein
MRCRRPLILTSVVAAAAAVTVLAAGCGGGGSRGVASITSSTTAATTTTQNGAVAFARCMRSHGVLGFPDPNRSGQFEGRQLKSVRVSQSLARAANASCNDLLPNGLAAHVAAPQDTAQQTRTRLADELSFARCMRSNGVTRFPDPPAQGDLTVAMVQAQGIDVHSPAVLRVVRACLPASHGWLSPARVREALHNAGG